MTECVLGHKRQAMECPACSEARGRGEMPVEHWKWYRGRTSSITTKGRIDRVVQDRIGREGVTDE